MNGERKQWDKYTVLAVVVLSSVSSARTEWITSDSNEIHENHYCAISNSIIIYQISEFNNMYESVHLFSLRKERSNGCARTW